MTYRARMQMMKEQLKTNAPPISKVPVPTISNNCLVCGNKMELSDPICDSCNRKRKWDVSRLIIPLFTLSVMALSFCFLIIVNNEEVLDAFDIDLEGRTNAGYLFLILGIISTMAISWERRRSLSDNETYRYILPILSIVTIPLSIVLLSMDPRSMIAIVISIIIIPTACVILFVFRKETKAMGLLSFFLIGLGSFLSLMGIMFSIRDLELTSLIWFLSGKHVAVLGVIFLSLGSYSAVSRNSLITKANSSPVYFIIATLILIPLILFRNGSQSEILDLLIVLPFLFLVCSTSSFLTEVVNDYRIERLNSDMKDSLKRADDLEKRKKIFYALQQIDRAIRSNPVDGFGREPDHSSIIFQIEGRQEIEDFSFLASEYEISMNEKGKILSSQGKFTEAAREYQEAVKRNPDFIESYQNLAMLLSSIPGRKKEASKHLDYLLGSKGMYVERWMRYGLPTRYVYWMADSLGLYREMLQKKSDMLFRLSRDGDIWAYYSVVRY